MKAAYTLQASKFNLESESKSRETSNEIRLFFKSGHKEAGTVYSSKGAARSRRAGAESESNSRHIPSSEGQDSPRRGPRLGQEGVPEARAAGPRAPCRAPSNSDPAGWSLGQGASPAAARGGGTTQAAFRRGTKVGLAPAATAAPAAPGSQQSSLRSRPGPSAPRGGGGEPAAPPPPRSRGPVD